MALHPKKPRDLVVVQVGHGIADAFNFRQIRQRIRVQLAFFDGQEPREKLVGRGNQLFFIKWIQTGPALFFECILQMSSMLCGAVLCQC